MAGGDESDNDLKQASAAAKEVFDVAEQMAALAAHGLSGSPNGNGSDGS